MPATAFDAVIVGAGPIGASAAALLAQGGAISPQRIALVDQRAPQAWSATDPVDLRVFALSRASERILRTAGAWPRIRAARISEYERMQVWHASVAPRSDDALVFSADEVGERNLGYIVENRVLQGAAFEAARAAGVNFVQGALETLEFTADAAVPVVAGQRLTTRLVIGADGSASRVRSLAELGVSSSDYLQVAIVCIVRTEQPHERAAWQRFLPEGTLAFLPLADGSSSIVWSLPNARAETLLAASPREFAAELARDGDEVLGAVELISERASFPLRKLSAAAYVRERVALVGDAAHVIHPLAGQGANLGLLDAATLVDVLHDGIGEREDLGALRLLRRFERWRRSENQLVSAAMDGFNRFLANGAGPVATLAQRGLSLVNHAAPVKRFFIDRALGNAGDLPSAAR